MQNLISSRTDLIEIMQQYTILLILNNVIKWAPKKSPNNEIYPQTLAMANAKQLKKKS